MRNSNEPHFFSEEVRKKRRDSVAKKLMNAYRKRKRKEKISKLLKSDDHWKGLS